MDKPLFIQKGTAFIKFPAQDILYIQTKKNGCEAITVSKKKTFYNNISIDLLEEYLTDDFCRINKSTIIFANRIDYIVDGKLCLKGLRKYFILTAEGMQKIRKVVIAIDEVEAE